MAHRKASSSEIGHAGAAPGEATAAADAPAEPGLELAQEWADRALESAHGALAWMARWQQTHTQSLNNWALALDAARRDLARAHDAPTLLAAQMECAGRQLGLALERMGGAWKLLLEDEWRLGERLRGEAAAAAARGWRSIDA